MIDGNTCGIFLIPSQTTAMIATITNILAVMRNLTRFETLAENKFI